MRNIYGATEEVTDHLEYVKPTNEEDALEAAYEALEQYIDSALIYTADILELWDGGTHEEVGLGSHDDIMEAITLSTYLQLREDWGGAILDGIEQYVGQTDLSLDDALAVKNG